MRWSMNEWFMPIGACCEDPILDLDIPKLRHYLESADVLKDVAGMPCTPSEDAEWFTNEAARFERVARMLDWVPSYRKRPDE